MAYGGGSRQQRSCCGGLCSFIIAAGFVILIYWAIFQPHHIRATVASATLTNLTVSPSSGPNPSISYSLSLELSLYNPSLRVAIYYDAFPRADLRSVSGVFLGPAATVSPSEFLQSKRSTDSVKLEFDGTKGVGVPGDVAGEMGKEAAAGAVRFEVAVDARVRYKFASIKIRQKPRIWCVISVPVKPEPRGQGFEGAIVSGDRCSVKY
ncbi:uncharacterized protein LOC100839350 [Brachypodium distachyon]|uniref:Uncharacterized protein n=1 Tax=Brachypodium distachyon TaxID=15368 RepID=I1IU72_BRADI|nr:uncharacterized protein LOC100839350 [Brachypodium distachyon]KQJ92167.1 hypothetical protein BRADI_4g42030v3 [Brachypodium distachyon]|eukprot:XP_003578885.1 uncharacterized protein LOC100839350 [Brachypodium distachyon]